jgi:hypothetical protein
MHTFVWCTLPRHLRVRLSCLLLRRRAASAALSEVSTHRRVDDTGNVRTTNTEEVMTHVMLAMLFPAREVSNVTAIVCVTAASEDPPLLPLVLCAPSPSRPLRVLELSVGMSGLCALMLAHARPSVHTEGDSECALRCVPAVALGDALLTDGDRKCREDGVQYQIEWNARRQREARRTDAERTAAEALAPAHGDLTHGDAAAHPPASAAASADSASAESASGGSPPTRPPIQS